jgi:large subunit ribosomal protein L3
VSSSASAPTPPGAGRDAVVEHFVKGQKVDVTGITKGKGFAGAMKRWNFAGLEASHGVSVSHRRTAPPATARTRARPSRTRRWPGHLGVERVTTQNLEVAGHDAERGLLLVKGAVPGPKGGYVLVRDAVKRARPRTRPSPRAGGR